jgi:hypothetical protein
MKEAIEVKRKQLDLDPIKVYNTKDYDIFRKKEGNRQINLSLVNKLYRSILDNGWYDVSILIVGDNMTLLDGQHRVEALKRIFQDTGVLYRIKYIVNRDFDDLKKIVSWQKDRAAWAIMDFAQSYATMGNEHYKTYIDFRAKYKMSHTGAMLLLLGKGSSGGSMSQRFKSGHFLVDDYSRSEEWALRLQSLVEHYDFAYNRSFIIAMIKMWRHPQFSHIEFMEKVSKFQSLIYSCVNVKQYYELIGELYNYHKQNRIFFDFKS